MKRKSLFVRLMGDSPRMRVLDYLLTERELDFSKSDIAANAGVGRATLYRIWDEMIASGIVVYTRTIGTAKLYKLNLEKDVVQKLVEIDDLLLLGALSNKSRKATMQIGIE